MPAAGQGASNRKVPQVAFKPDWTKHANAAPFTSRAAVYIVLVFYGAGLLFMAIPGFDFTRRVLCAMAMN